MSNFEGNIQSPIKNLLNKSPTRATYKACHLSRPLVTSTLTLKYSLLDCSLTLFWFFRTLLVIPKVMRGATRWKFFLQASRSLLHQTSENISAQAFCLSIPYLGTHMFDGRPAVRLLSENGGAACGLKTCRCKVRGKLRSEGRR